MEHKTPEYKKMNPMGTLPVIKDGDYALAESHTIMKYLIAKYGKAEHKLYPSDIKQQAAIVDLAMFFDTGVAFIRIKRIALPAIFGDDTEMSAEIKKEVEDVYETVEMYLNGRDYVASSEFTIADLTYALRLSLGSTVIALSQFWTLDAKKYPRTAAWLDRLRQKPFFQTIALPGTQDLAAFVKSMWEKNKAKKH